jgi:hypothetical protein
MDDGQPGSYAVVPVKSDFDQVHVASTASEPNLAKTPFLGGFDDVKSHPGRKSCPEFHHSLVGLSIALRRLS